MSSSGPREPAQLIFDGDCGFCRRSVRWVLQRTAGRVTAVESQTFHFDSAPEGVTVEAAGRAVHLLEPVTGAGEPRVFRGAAALARALSKGSALGWIWLCWSLIPGLAWLAERLYRVVAGNRVGASRLLRLIGGNDPSPPQWRVGRSLLLSTLGLGFAIELYVLWSDLPGLVGEDGIRPLRFLFPVESVQPDADDYLLQPSPLWLFPEYGALRGLLLAGVVGGLLAATGRLARQGLFVAWVALLSFVALLQPPVGYDHGGNVFAGFPADALLLEVGFLTWLCVAPGYLRRRRSPQLPAPLGMFLLRFTLGRALLLEGVAQLQADSWALDGARSLHWWTQVLPTTGGLQAGQMAGGVASVLGGLLVAAELAAPLLVFGPRRVRSIGVVLVLVHEAVRAWTGLHGAYPLVLAGLALASVDDATWRRLLPVARWRESLAERVDPVRRFVPCALRGLFATAFVVLALSVSAEFLSALRIERETPGRLGSSDFPHPRFAVPGQPIPSTSRWFVCNGYAPAAEVRALQQNVAIRAGQPPAFGGKHFRPVLCVELRDADGRWHLLEPKQATGGPLRLPPSGPSFLRHRLDALWIEAARQVALTREPPPWFTRMLGQLLAEPDAVRQLFANWPADAGVPEAARVRAFGYRPADAAKRASGQGFDRRPLGIDGPAFRLVDGVLLPEVGGDGK